RQCELLTGELANSMTAIEKERESWNTERAEVQRVIPEQVTELQAARNSAAEQTCALTIALNEKSATTNAAEAELRSKLSDLEQRLAVKQREIESLGQQLESRSAQDCALTIALNEQTYAENAAESELQARLTELERQLAVKQSDIETLQGRLDSRPVQDCAMTIDLSAQSAASAAAVELKTKLTNLEDQLAVKQSEIESLQQRLDCKPAQDCAMTIAFNEQSAGGNSADGELQAKLLDLEQQLALKQTAIDSLHERIDAHAAVQHRLERLAGEFDAKCRELEEARGQLAAAGDAGGGVPEQAGGEVP